MEPGGMALGEMGTTLAPAIGMWMGILICLLIVIGVFRFLTTLSVKGIDEVIV